MRPNRHAIFLTGALCVASTLAPAATTAQALVIATALGWNLSDSCWHVRDGLRRRRPRRKRRREKPRHPVTISKPFYLAKHEVTLAESQEVMGSSPYDQERSNPFLGLPGMAARVNRPTTLPPFRGMTHRSSSASSTRRKATRATGSRRGPSGNMPRGRVRPPPTHSAMMPGNSRATRGTARILHRARPTLSVRRSPIRGASMTFTGMWGWVQDWYSDSYYASSPAVDPLGPARGPTGWCVGAVGTRPQRAGGRPSASRTRPTTAGAARFPTRAVCRAVIAVAPPLLFVAIRPGEP